MDPAELIRDLAPLDACEGVIQLLSYLADLVIIDGVDLIVNNKVADGGDNGGSAAAPRLFKSAVLAGGLQLFKAEQALCHLIAAAFKKLDAGFAGDARQD